MRSQFKKAMFGITLVGAMLSSGACMCESWGILTPSEQATLQAEMCGPMKITSVTGLPYGPVTIHWTEDNHAKSSTEIDYFYQVFLSELTTNPQHQSVNLAEQLVKAPTKQVTFNLDADLAKQAKADGGLYDVVIYAETGFGPKFDELAKDCVVEMKINNAPLKQKKAPVDQATPTATFVPPVQPTVTPTVMAPLPQPKQPTIIVPTPCPLSQQGDPAHGVPCIDIPR